MSNESKVKKVAILYSGGKSLSGIEKYLIQLFENVDKNELDLELLSLGEWPLTEHLSVFGFKVKIFNGARVNFGTVKQIGQYCQRTNVDLLVSQGTVANTYARLVSKFYKIKNLVTAHSEPKGDYSNPAVRAIYWTVDHALRRYTTKYIAVSRYLANYLVKSGIPKSKISVVYNGSDYPKPSAKAHKRLVIGSIGRLHFVKGYDLLIQAFALLDNKRLRLKIAGVGDELDNLRQLAIEHGVSDRVEFVGYKSDIFEFLDTIDVYVQPSRSEGFGLALVQAMSQNLPVVVTPAGAMTEIVTDGQTGYVSSDMSAESLAAVLKKAVENIAESTRIGENAGKYVNENFSIEKWANQTLAAYRKAIK